MYDWVRALLDPTDIVQSPTSAKKQITPPPKFELPMDEPSSSRRSRRSVSPSKKSTSPRKSRTVRSAKDVLSTPSTAAANSNLQEALEITASMEAANGPIRPVAVDEVEVKDILVQGSPEKKKGRKSKKAAAETEEDQEEEEEQKEKKKSEKKEKKKTEKTEKKKKDIKEEMEIEVTEAVPATEDSTKTTLTLDMPITLPEVPSAAETQEMIAKAKEMVEEAIKSQAEGSVAGPSSVTVTKKRKPEEDDEEAAAEASQRAKKAKVLEEKLKRERVRNRALFGVSAAFALAYVLNAQPIG